MAKGKWADTSTAKRSAAARKGAAARKARIRAALNGGKPLMTQAAIAKARGADAERVLDGPSISTILDRVKAAAAAQRADEPA